MHLYRLNQLCKEGIGGHVNSTEYGGKCWKEVNTRQFFAALLK